MIQLPTMATLWIGDRLSWLEQLSLKSFVDAGHETILYSYEKITNAPSGVTVCDARDIFPESEITSRKGAKKPPIHVDIWQLHLMQQTDYIWFNADVLCVKPFDFESPFVFGFDKQNQVGNAVLRLPSDSATLKALLKFTSDPDTTAPWLNPEQQLELEKIKDRGDPIHLSEQSWELTGPHVLNHYLKEMGEWEHALSQSAFYPIAFKDRNKMIRKKFDIEKDFLTPDTYAVNMWARRMKPRLEEAENNHPGPNSYMDLALTRHKVVPSEAPIDAKENASKADEGDIAPKAPVQPLADTTTKTERKSVHNWPLPNPRVLAVTCMKDEGPFILEWLAWNRAIGVTDFVIFTNHCSDGTVEILDRLEAMGEVTHLPNPALATEATNFQPLALKWMHHLRAYREADFVISMDVDEFINIQLGVGCLTDLFTAIGPFDALSISEINHGSNNLIDFETGWVKDQFPRHETLKPGLRKSRRGVKTITRLSDKLQEIRNHRPDFKNDASVVWLNGSGQQTDVWHADASVNGVDVRGTYDLVSLEHYALRSLNSFFMKMIRGDVVVADKPASQRYWRQRNSNDNMSSSYNPEADKAARAYHRDRYETDEKLMELQRHACEYHKNKIREIIKLPEIIERHNWIMDEAWDAKS
ncbi:hypothetical protein GGR95_001208 [Sulfitobacter undariae]|uniref:Glycosyl transferase family 2 n=1 Tax=Sulfitobacter undariae TaxID=1563671 RepID=A0A7W6E2I1_9RHOB|nr:glycosyltransferase family 2 protein [Sulfitobacter undariae]MBB3993577.1 hypothetical protein [Sulfitobacter undariae]